MSVLTISKMIYSAVALLYHRQWHQRCLYFSMKSINNIDGVRAMDFVYLRTFCEVAYQGNFTRAAQALGYAQSSVTTQIQKLEEQ